MSDQNPSDKHPVGHNAPCLLPFVGRLGSGPRLVGRMGSGVRVSVSFQPKNTRRVLSYDVLRQQKTGVMTKGRFDLPSSPEYNVEPVTNSSSSSCANNGRRTLRWVLDACCRSSRICFSHFATRTVDNTVDLYASFHIILWSVDEMKKMCDWLIVFVWEINSNFNFPYFPNKINWVIQVAWILYNDSFRDVIIYSGWLLNIFDHFVSTGVEFLANSLSI